MEILWDPPKRLANLDKHGLDFADLRQEFFDTAILVPARDRRIAAIGRLDDGTITVIFFRLGREAISVISMRPASLAERRVLHDH